ncbi:hypothetical protein CC78DRAFT_23582 [Lojkania enalia]|uniref:Uncharacterized protein n=1 Tax=Lojkania enalia TaxID=147567 RepID=A0A9P4KJC9_9PLEO|nr:hypothetical protein CC78DRAFT_23582 [Didymosphaeria enalia]
MSLFANHASNHTRDSPSITASTLPLRQKFDPRSVEDGYGVGKEEVGESTLGSKKPHVVESKSSKSDGLGSSVRRAGRKKGSNESSNSGIGLGPDNAGGTEREWDDGAPPRPVYRLSQAPSSSTRPFLTKEPEEMSVGPPVENAPSTPNSRNLTHRSLFAKAASWPPPALKPAKVVGCSAPSTPRGRYTGERLIQSRVLTTPNQRSWANQSHGDRIQLDLSLEEYYELLANARWREGFEMGTRMHDFYAERELNRFAMEG